MVHRHYFRPVRKIWRCAGCREDFPVTSGTIFAFHKLPLRLHLAAVILFVNAVKGISALQLGRDLGVSPKTAYVLLHKMRESLLSMAFHPHARRERRQSAPATAIACGSSPRPWGTPNWPPASPAGPSR